MPLLPAPGTRAVTTAMAEAMHRPKNMAKITINILALNFKAVFPIRKKVNISI